MNTVVISSLKGGVGKTLHVAHLSVQLEAMGQGPVVIMDLDPQGTLSSWWNDRQAETPQFAKVKGVADLAIQHEKLKRHFKWCIIDTPPQKAEINAEAIALADLVIIPCKHSKGDIEATLTTIELCENAGKKFMYLLNETKGKSVIDNTVRRLAAFGPVIPQTVPNLNGYWQSMYTGQTINEISKTTGALIIADLAKFIVAKFEKAPVREKAHV